MLFASFTVLKICNDGAKAMVGKIPGALAPIKAVAPNCISHYRIVNHYSLAVKILILLNLDTYTDFFLKLCAKMRSVMAVFKKVLMQLFEL